jgi:hypothetical protein
MTWTRILNNANRVGPVNLYLHDCVNQLMDRARRGVAYPWNSAAFTSVMPLDEEGNAQLFDLVDSIATTARGMEPCYTSYYLNAPHNLESLRDPFILTRTWLQPRPWVLPALYMHWTTTFQILDLSKEAPYMKFLQRSEEFPNRQRLEEWARAHPLPLKWLPYKQPDLGAPCLLPTTLPLERMEIPGVQFGTKVSTRPPPT